MNLQENNDQTLINNFNNWNLYESNHIQNLNKPIFKINGLHKKIYQSEPYKSQKIIKKFHWTWNCPAFS